MLPDDPDPAPPVAPALPRPSDEPSLAADPAAGRAQRLDPRLVPCERLGGGLFLGGLSLGAALGLLFLALGGEVPRARLLFLALLALALLGALAAVTWIHPARKLAVSWWRLTDEGLEIRSGVWFQHLRSVPRARVQHTDVERGPIERRFGLATLVVYTAGHQDSEVRLEGLEHATAVAIRDRLLAGEGAHDGA